MTPFHPCSVPIAITAAVALWLASPFGSPLVREIRAEALANRAEQAIEHNRKTLALEFTSAAWELRPQNVDTLSSLLRSGLIANAPETSMIAEAILNNEGRPAPLQNEIRELAPNLAPRLHPPAPLSSASLPSPTITE